MILRNALVYTGFDEAPKTMDVRIQGERIKELGMNLEGDEVFDCKGLSLAPGFIDAHSHNDFFVDKENNERFYLPFLFQGITTQVTGNCGFSQFGVEEESEYKEEVGAGLFETESPGSLEMFRRSSEGKLPLNLVPLVGHGTTRIGVSGLSPEKLTKEKENLMLKVTEKAMEEGAFGGSLGLMYEPGMYAPKEELINFAKVIKKHDGILTVHARALSKVSLGYPLLSKPHLELALDEMLEVMEESKVKLQYSHLIFVGESSWKSVDRMLGKIHKAKEDGYDIAYDNYSLTYGASVITVICPPWYMALSHEEKKKPFNRLKLRTVINVTKKLLGIDFSDITIAYLNEDPYYKAFEGRRVSDLAKELKRDPLDLYLEFIDVSQGAGKVYLDKYYNEAIIRKLMEDDLSIFMTDAWVEGKGYQNGSAFQSFPDFLLKAKEYGIPLYSVIHKMTKKSADRFNIKDRGVIKEGAYADLVLFNEKELKVFPKEPSRQAEGITHVLMKGEWVIKDKNYQGKKLGEVLRMKK